MRTTPRLIAAAGLFLATACADGPTTNSLETPIAQVDQRAADTPRLSALTRNMYVGADLDAVIGALASPDPSDDFAALLTAIGTLQRTDFPARARAMADEIARGMPDVVGLQEVSEIHVDLSPVGMPLTIDLDFLAVLQAELAARGLSYVVAARVQNSDAAPVPFVRLIDFDVLLVNAQRVTVEPDPIARNFAYNIGTIAPGVTIKRGYVIARISLGGTAVTVVNTHLESGSDPQIAQLRAAQAMELATVLGAASPVLLLGDLNDAPGSVMTQVLAGAGMRDAWAVLRPGTTGLTCCHVADLSNPRSTFTQRIDYIWERGLEQGSAGLTGVMRLSGVEAAIRVAGPAGLIWPSDHGAVFADFAVGRDIVPIR